MFGAKFRLWSAALSAAFGCGFLIYSTYVTNNVQVVGEKWLNQSYFDIHGTYPSAESLSMLWATVIASKEVGKVIGTFLIPLVAEKMGRRGGLLFNNFVTITGCFLCYMSLSWPYYTILVGRLLLGISMICGVGLASLFLIEIAPMNFRGASGALIQIFRGFGGTLGMVFTLPDLLGTDTLWTTALALPAIPAIIQLIVLTFSAESPRHLLITNGETQKAERAIRFYQGSGRVEEAMEELKSEKSRITQQTKISFSEILKSRDFWRPVLLTSLALTNRSLAGILPVQTYSTDMFIETGISHSIAAYSTVGLGICHLISAILVTFTVERYGRRSMLIWGNFGCLLTMSAVSLFSYLSQSFTQARMATVVSLSLFMLVYPVVASVSNIAASELCHQKIRSTAFTIGLLCYSTVGFISTFAYPLLKRWGGLSFSFLPSCLCLIITIVVYFLYLPETRGKTFESLAFHGASPKKYRRRSVSLERDGMGGEFALDSGSESDTSQESGPNDDHRPLINGTAVHHHETKNGLKPRTTRRDSDQPRSRSGSPTKTTLNGFNKHRKNQVGSLHHELVESQEDEI